MPTLAQQVGVWAGEYVHFDVEHREIDRHRSKLIARLIKGPDGNERFVQSNIYDWADGSREIRFFEGDLKGDRIVISNVNINGWVAPLAMDETARTIMVLWTRAGEPDFRFYEMITTSEDGLAKNRTWHWYRKGRLFQRTLINEVLVTRDWQAHDDPGYYGFSPRAMP
jgi:hypothetical protein